MKWLLIVGTAALVWLGTATGANSGGSRATKIPGCAPQCLTPAPGQPGNLPAGKYQTRYFFAGADDTPVREGLVRTEDSTGEFGASPKNNRTHE